MNTRFTSNIQNGDALKAFQELMKKQRTLLSGLLAVKGGRALINVALKLHRLLQAKAPTKSNVRICKDFAFKIYKLAKANSVNFVILYLKTCSIMLQQSVAKHTVKTNSREIGMVAVSATRSGLPRIIPRVHRVLIRRGNTKTITLWLSLFNLYRYLECAYKKKDHFATITEPNDWAPSSDLSDFVPIFWARLKRLLGDKFPASNLRVKVPQIIQSVSVNVTERMGLKGSSLFAAMTSIHNFRFIANVVMKAHLNVNAFKESGLSKEEFVGFQKLLLGLSNLATSWWPDLLSVLMGPLNRADAVAKMGKGMMPWPEVPGYELINKRAWLSNFTRPNAQLAEIWNSVIGRLSLFLFGKKETYVPAFGRLVKLYEAAGKVRIIAIVDPITNWLLKPLHDWVFAILREIPNDGTFDQDKPLIPLSKSGKTYLGSCDMSAATDRLPVKLQALLLSHIFGPKIAESWMRLLVSRPYIGDRKNIWYAVGQPMGALSSWAMLALTHHFMWQWAAYRCNYTGGWFKSYAVLGDDSVAAVKPIVLEYLKICSELGVKVNLAKSLLSPVGVFEFAKRFITPFGNCSPISIGEILVADKNFATMSNLPRKRKIRFSDLLSIMGYRHKVTGSMEKRLHLLPKRVRNMLLVLRSPWGAYPTTSLLKWLSLDGYHRFKEKDLSNLGINILVCIDKLRTKIIHVVDSNNMNYKMSGIGGDGPSETKTQEVREVDPQTFRVLMDLVLEPARKDLFFKAVTVLIAVKDLQLEIQKRIFFLSESECEYYWEQYLKYEKEFHAMFGGDVYLQKVEKPFVEPSPRQIVSLWNRLQRPPSAYTSKKSLPDIALLRTVDRLEFDKNKEKLWSALVNVKHIPKDMILSVLITKTSRIWVEDAFMVSQPIPSWDNADEHLRMAYIYYAWEQASKGVAIVSGKVIRFPPVNLPFNRFLIQWNDRLRTSPNWILAIHDGFNYWVRNTHVGVAIPRKYPDFSVLKKYAEERFKKWCENDPSILDYIKRLREWEERQKLRDAQKASSKSSSKGKVKQTIHEIHEIRDGGVKKVHSFPVPLWAVDSDKYEYIEYVKRTGIYAWDFQKWYDFKYKYSPGPPPRKS